MGVCGRKEGEWKGLRRVNIVNVLIYLYEIEK
jgi:hypothetical protein